MDYPMRDRESREPTTVLDHLRPTVVVRRRVVVDVAALKQQKLERPEDPEPSDAGSARASGCYLRAGVASDDESAPPSSIIAPEAGGSSEEEALDVRDAQEEAEAAFADEREQDLPPSVRESSGPTHDDVVDAPAHEPTAPQAPTVDVRPAIPVGPTIAVGTLAKRLGLPSAQVAAELVSRGFFEVTPATILTRDTARIMADAFGRAVEEVPEPEPVKAPRKRTARRAPQAKRTAKGSKTKKRTGGGGRTKRAA